MLWSLAIAVLVVLLAVLLATTTRQKRTPGPAAPVPPLPADLQSRVRQLVGENKRIHAVKEVREALGLSLLDAKNAVDAIAAGRPLPTTASTLQQRPDLADRARSLAATGRHDEAVRLVATETGMSAPEADTFIRALLP